ncbi:hypothetical protein NDU88_009420 [Pleurodeles waltl]|uniref:Uncharacterized protein n=1 Tax=Pleurodeles waltl TaxID=8319 RepID=A0AAV7RW67_PLEWA|nr:hypothetical protein NDU88_009420 [Pleurodeles waltl]
MATKEASGSSEPGPAHSDALQKTEPTLRDIMTAIQSVKDTLETKVDTVTLELNLIKADLRKVTEKLTGAARSYALTMQQRLYDVGYKANKLLIWLDRRDPERSCMLEIDDKRGKLQQDSPTIANIFTDYYEELYHSAIHMGDTECADIRLNELEEELRVVLEEDLTVEEIT